MKRINIFWLAATAVVYVVIAILYFNNCYFWDNIQQTSKEAHWFYLTNFQSFFITPGTPDGIIATGYHPPLMGMMTALLWKIFGYELWVSHIFAFFWFVILIYNVWKLTKQFVSERYQGIVTAIILLESAVLTQFTIASPDFILLTSFVISVRAILEKRRVMLAVGIFFLCCINMRGVFAGTIIFAAHNYYEYLISGRKYNLSGFVRVFMSYLPTLLILLVYYVLYFMKNGWFIDNTISNHYALPANAGMIMKHATEFIIRTLENGRFLVWLVGIYAIFRIFGNKRMQNPSINFIALIFVLLAGLYILFIFITQMPFGSRYFMPHSVLVTLLASNLIVEAGKKKKTILFSLILALEITGHFWIYPDKIAKAWDATLAHLPHYELREACFDYIEKEKIDYNGVAGGFCFYGDQRFIDLRAKKLMISSDPSSCNYFIYSNISNNEDNLVEELKDKDKWEPIRYFKKGFVSIILYKRLLNHE